MGISRVFYKDTLVSVRRINDQFQLCLDYAGQPSNVGDTLKRWPEIDSLREYFTSDYDAKAVIPTNKLLPLRDELKSLASDCERFKKIDFIMDASFMAVRVQNSPPDDFCLNYKWSGGCLCLSYPQGVVELDAGYYRLGDMYWTNSSLSAMDQARIRRKTIGKGEILEFLGRDLVVYAAAGIRYISEINLDTIPALELTIETVDREQVVIHRKWNAPSEHIDADFDMNGYVVAGRTLRPGIRPKILESYIKFDGSTATLRGLQIAKFLDNGYWELKPWFLRGTDSFEATHVFITPPYDWILTASADEKRGIGRAAANPVAIIDKREFSVDEIMALMKTPYAHLEGGWVRRSDLYTLGLNERGDWTGNGKLGLLSLNAAQVVYQGDDRLNGPWKHMDTRGAQWCSSAVKQRCAREHLSFLTHWGISGGITGGFDACVLYGNDLLNDLFSREKNFKALVVGSESDLQEYKSRAMGFQAVPIAEYDEHLAELVCLARYDKDAEIAAARGISWDVTFLIEPDMIFIRDNDARLDALVKVKTSIIISFCVQTPDLWNERPLLALKRLTKLDKNLLALLIQNPRAPKPRPLAYVFNVCPVALAKPCEAPQDSGAEYVLQGEPAQGTPVPPRETPIPDTRTSSPVSVEVSYITDASGDSFLREARRLVNKKGDADAVHVPFSCYWPKYSDMSVAQRRWYFRLRNDMRRGEYPDTDLSYLFVRIYELINLVSCENADDALIQLTDIWTHYRERYPKLDNYLDDWTFDFLFVNKHSAPIEEYVSKAPALVPEAADMLLMGRNADKPLILSVAALEALSGYRIGQSKFYLAGHGDMVNKVLPMAMAWVDAKIKERESDGLLGRFPLQSVAIQRTAFRGAVVSQSSTYEINIVPYHACDPFKELLSQMIRYTENLLRGRFGYSSKLRGVEVPDDIRDWLDAYVSRQFAKKTDAAKERRIALDSGMVKKLRSDSDEVRDTLIASIAGNDMLPPEPYIETPARPCDTPDGLLTDLEPVNRILSGISNTQKKILSEFAASGWETDAGKLARVFPGVLLEAEIDKINELALRYLGVALVAREEGLLVVADDYTDEVDYLLKNGRSKDTGGWKVDTQGLEEAWTDFFDTVDLQVLGALLEGEGALVSLARERGEMPDLLVDAINAAAMDSIGDLIVDGEAISDEYRQTVEQHMRKA